MARKVLYYLAGAVALLTFLVYLPALRNDFIELDDAAYVLDNPHIRSFGPDLFRWAFLQFSVANWHPLTWLSHAVDYALWGLNPLGHHLTNILLHVVNTFLVVVLSALLLETGRKMSAPRDPAPSILTDRTILIAAGVTGLLFGLHPVHVESVAWVAERKDLLCALFFLMSIIVYATSLGRGETRAESGGGTPGALSHARFADRHYLASLGLFVLALLSKPMAVTLPAVLLLLDWFPAGRIRDLRTFQAAMVGKLPFISLSLASSIITILAQRSGEALVSTQLVPLPARALVAIRSLLTYLAKMIVPSDLAPYYPYPGLHEISLYRAEYLIPAVLFIVITAMCIVMVKRQKMWLAAWSYYLLTLLPVLGIIQVGGQAMADRYTYLPGIGPFLIAGLGAAWIHARTYAGAGGSQTVRGISIAAAVLIILLLSSLTVRQIGIWKNSMSVFDAVLAKDARRSPMVFFHRGVAYEKLGKHEMAIDDYSRAISLFPSYYEAFFSRGTAYDRMGQFDLAIEDYTQAISLRPSSYEAYTNRGMVNEKMGRRSEAVADFDRAIALSTSAGKAYYNLGIINFEDGLFAEAIEQFSRTIAIDPMDADSYGNRGIAYAITGHSGAALKDFDKAVELRPDFATMYYNRGKLHAASGRRERASEDYQKACQLGDEMSCQALRELITQ